jgi:hypothetical protein
MKKWQDFIQTDLNKHLLASCHFQEQRPTDLFYHTPKALPAISFWFDEAIAFCKLEEICLYAYHSITACL